MNLKKRILIILIGILLSCMLYAVGESEESGTDTAITEIDGVFDIILTEESGQDQWAEKFQEITGVKINIVKPVHNQYSEILGATFASGDLPDICEIQTADILAYAKSGNLVPLNDFIKASDAVKDVPDQFIEAYRLSDGNIYTFPLNRGGGCVLYMRTDWLDNLGLDVPTTYDEFYEVLKAFTFDDPDGNGQDDTIGYTLPFSVSPLEFDYYNRFIMQDAMFGWQLKRGKWVDGFLEPEMEDALARFQKLYAEGLIDTEFFSNKTSTARSKIYEGQAGMMEYWSGSWAQRFDESAKNTNPDAVVDCIPPIKEAFYLNRVAVAFGITTAAKNPGAVFDAFINSMLDKGEGQILFTYGIEGVHFEKDGNAYKMLPDLVNPDRTFDKAYVHPELTLNDWDLMVPLDPRIAKSREIHVEYSEQLYLPEGGDNYVTYIGELLTLKQEIFSKIVVGDLSVDAGLAEYKDRAEGLHLSDMLAELND